MFFFCSRCGQRNSDGSAFCWACGNALSVPGHVESEASPTQNDPQEGGQTQEEIPSYLALSIIATLLCCLPAGIVAIVFAAQVTQKQACGDIAGARKASDTARTWCAISLGLGLIIGVLYLAAHR